MPTLTEKLLASTHQRKHFSSNQTGNKQTHSDVQCFLQYNWRLQQEELLQYQQSQPERKQATKIFKMTIKP